jgi:hypothetical protein
MTRLAPSFIGTFVATVAATAYVILDEDKYHLWTPGIRYVLMGGAVLVLLTYTISIYFLEKAIESDHGEKCSWLDFALRVLSQLLIGLSLAAIGVNPLLFILLFMGFVGVCFSWSALWFKLTKPVFPHDAANFVMCVLYSYMAWRLFSEAIAFEESYSVMITDPASFEVRIMHLRGLSSDMMMGLGAIVGGLFINLIVLLCRHPFIRLRSIREPSSPEA